MFPPTRIVCLTEETVETLYLLGEQDRIVGISGYVVRPPQARREKPRVSAFTSANIDKILALKPDLILTFSDLQADIAADLIRRGLNGAARTRLSRGSRALRRASYTPPERHIFTPSTPKTYFGYLPQVPHRKGDRQSGAAPGHCADARWRTFVDDCDRFRTIMSPF
jgi:hypothetical protein